jgi:hypothetical protein
VTRFQTSAVVRGIAGAGLLLGTLAPAGCSWRVPFVRNTYPLTCDIPHNPTVDDVLVHLNANTARVQSWRCTDVKIRSSGPLGLPVTLSAMLAVETPRHFRLLAHSMAGNEGDLGSNDERFWFWVRRADPPYIFTCRHDRVHIAQKQLRLPFRPDWMMEALGVVRIDPGEIGLETDPRQPHLVRLIRHRTSPQGQAVRQMTVVDVRQGILLEHHLWDGAGQPVAHARFQRHQRCAATGAVLPHRIELDWPQEQLGLSLELGQIEVNPGALPTTTFEVPEIEGSPEVDLGLAPTHTPGLRE